MAAQAAPPDKAAIAHQIPGRDLSLFPPIVNSIHVFPINGIGTGTGRLEVSFKETLPRALSFIYEGAAVSLRDDGTGGDKSSDDGIYSAVIKVDSRELLGKATTAPQAPKDLVARMAQSSGGIPVTGQSGAAPQAVSAFATATAAVDPAFLVNPEKALLIRDVRVLNHYYRATDPCKDPAKTAGDAPPPDSARHWSFGHLFTQMANQSSTKMTTSDFALKWLDEWARKQTINGDPLQETDGSIPAKRRRSSLRRNGWPRARQTMPSRERLRCIRRLSACWPS